MGYWCIPNPTSAQKLSYVMSLYYESQNRNAQACSFAGNATVNSAAPSGSGGAGAAALACLSNPSATFVPSSPVSNPTATVSGSGSSGRPSSAMSLVGDLQSIAVALGLSTVGALWTLMA
jgi:1,3-beta-glucanosyltransferase GAS1